MLHMKVPEKFTDDPGQFLRPFCPWSIPDPVRSVRSRSVLWGTQFLVRSMSVLSVLRDVSSVRSVRHTVPGPFYVRSVRYEACPFCPFCPF